MSASAAPALDAIAFQLVASLDRYDQDADLLVQTWLDMELYADVSAQVDRIRLYSAALPQFSVGWVELLIAHTELVQALWQVSHGPEGGDPQAVLDQRSRHKAAVGALRVRCARLLARERAA